MDFQITQENFSKALGNVARVASGRSTLPILSNVLITTKDNRVCIAATNLDIAIRQFVGAKVEKDGSLTIPARLAQEFVSNLPEGNVSIKQEDHKLHIDSGSYTSVINGTPADEFPVMPAIKDGNSWKLNAQEFKKALQQVVFAASTDETRPVLTGALFASVGGNLYVVATDSYRLAEKIVTKNTTKDSLLIPATAVSELLRIIDDTAEEVTVLYDDQQVLFTIGDTELVARLIEGEYPDYKKLIPKTFDVQATVEKAELVNIVKVSSLFARESAGSITLSVDQKTGEIRVRSVASQVGENTASASADTQGSGEITLNSRYLLDCLSAIEGEKVQIGFNGKLQPLVVCSPKHKNYIHIVMPLKS